MTLKLVILNNPGKPVVELYDSKEFHLKTGDNVLPASIAHAFVGLTNRQYKILGPAENQNEPCPLCGQVIPPAEEPKKTEEELKKEQPRSAGVDTLPSAVKKPDESSEKSQDSTSDGDKLEGLDKTTLINLCNRQGIKANQTMSEDTLISKLRAILPKK